MPLVVPRKWHYFEKEFSQKKGLSAILATLW